MGIDPLPPGAAFPDLHRRSRESRATLHRAHGIRRTRVPIAIIGDTGITVGADGVATRLYAVVPGRRGRAAELMLEGVARLCLCSPSSGRARWAPTMCGRRGR